MNDFKTILLEILTIINYTDDKEAFIAEFIKNLQVQSVQDLIQALPADKLEAIKTQLSAVSNDPQKASEVMKSYFSEEQLRESVKNVARSAVSDYLTAIDNTLSDALRENLTKALEKYSSSQPASSNP
jgi:hypothetical protein